MRKEHIILLLMLCIVMVSCEGLMVPDVTIENPNNTSSIYSLTITAGKGEETGITRSLEIDNNGKLESTWTVGDSVTVYNETKKELFSGYLKAQSSGKTTILSGSIVGNASEGDILTLHYLSPNYSTQDGTLTGNDNSIDRVCDYAIAQITIEKISKGLISVTGDATFVNQQAIAKFFFRNQDNTEDIYVESLKVRIDNAVYTVKPSAPSKELYVAIPAFSNCSLSLLGENGNNIYSFEKNEVTFEKGKYYTITVRMNTQTVIGHIMDNIIKWNSNSVEDIEVGNYTASMQNDGSWADINYEDQSNSWEPQIHYQRLVSMSYSYINPLSAYYMSDEMYGLITKGIEYWLSLNAHSNNWYHNQINEPESFGQILIFMRKGAKHLSTEIEERIFERWRNNGSNPASMTGANKTQTALHWMYFACLMSDEDLLQTALDYLFEPIRYVDDEGFQVDGTFFQHGHQLYIGGYGEVLLESVLQSAVCVNSTKFSLPEEKLEILRDYVINTWSRVIRGEVMHWNAIGRQLTRPDFLKYPERRIPIIEKMIEVDGSNASIYSQIKSRLQGISSPESNISPYHKHYFRGDYTLHVRDGYSVSVRMASSRTARQEKANGENIKGYYLSFGATVITKTGREYLDIMPLWDWNKIPGVTAPKNFLYTGWWEGNGPSNFAGGVSCSTYGCSAYKYYDDTYSVNTGASKGYFFFDDEIVCLGAGISSNHSEAHTTVNQCWGQSNFIVGTETGNSVYGGSVDELSSNNYRWILHDGIGYFFPELQQITVENKDKTGNWNWISTLQADKDINGRVFSLGIEHTNPVQDQKYSYIIIPNSTVESLSSFATKNDIEILVNTDSVQIVNHKTKGLYECVFYKACSYKGDIEIYSQQPCVFIIRKRDQAFDISIADPVQSKSSMTIGIKEKDMENMVYGSCSFTGVEEQYAGKTIDFCISK